MVIKQELSNSLYCIIFTNCHVSVIFLLVLFSNRLARFYNRPELDSVIVYDVTCDSQSSRIATDCLFNIVTGRCDQRLNVTCPVPANCTNGDLRLSGGNTTLEGRLDVCNHGFWQGVYYAAKFNRIEPEFNTHNWSHVNTMVACRQLGLPWECKSMVKILKLFII